MPTKLSLRSVLGVFALLISLSWLSPRASAQPVVTDQGNWAALQAQLGQMGTYVKQMGGWVDLAHQQLDTLNVVSRAIGDLQGTIQSTVQGGLKGMLGKSGLGDVFNLGMQIASLGKDTMGLVAEIRALPEEAKRGLENIGLSAKDLEQYLSTGLVHDAYQGMGIDQWQQVVRDPAYAFQTGAVSRAIAQGEIYTGQGDIGEKYLAYVKSLSPEARDRMHISLGVADAQAAIARWTKRTGDSINKSLLFDVTTQKLLAEAAGEKKANGQNPVVNLTTLSQTGNALGAERNRIATEGLRQQQVADDALVRQGAAGLELQQADENRQRSAQRGAAVVPIE